jgi:hypothetical protein
MVPILTALMSKMSFQVDLGPH